MSDLNGIDFPMEHVADENLRAAIILSEDYSWERWKKAIESNPATIELLINRTINAEKLTAERYDKVFNLRKALTFSNRANASKRRQLRNLHDKFILKKEKAGMWRMYFWFLFVWFICLIVAYYEKT
jgi:hypothetical protein